MWIIAEHLRKRKRRDELQQLGKLLEWYPWLPRVGPTGSPFVSVNVCVETDNERYNYLQPHRPEQEYDELIDDGWDGAIYSHVVLTDEEYAAALVRYEAALAEWKRTGGTFFRPGPTHYEADFVCADGTVCRGVSDGRTKWKWTEWST